MLQRYKYFRKIINFTTKISYIMNISIIGGGAAGFFAAINLREFLPEAEITIYEATGATLSKVALSGGGRCNLTNTFEGFKGVAKIYPRGERIMQKALKIFNQNDTYDWFESRGVMLTTQSDGCVFPFSQESREITDLFLRLADEGGIEIKKLHRVVNITKTDNKFTIHTANTAIDTDIVIVTTGGNPKRDAYSFLENLPIEILDPIPSLFTLNVNDKSLVSLSGAVIPNALVRLKGTNVRTDGALLITHWGVSGPSILKLTSYAAQKLQQTDYHANILINWMGNNNEEEVRKVVDKLIGDNLKKFVTSAYPLQFSSRVWEHILQRADIPLERRYAELGQKGVNRIVAVLMGDEYKVEGKGTSKEEFVTCGGVSRHSINPQTLELRLCKGLYLAGEVLDIDGITGGFNLQAAWSTAYAVATAITAKE